MAKINWTDQAKYDIDNLAQFLAPQSETYAKIQIQRIFDKINLLTNLPRLGRVVYHIVSENRIDVLTVHQSAYPLDIKEL